MSGQAALTDGAPSEGADVRGALNGDRAALERLLRGQQRRVHALALRMLWCPHDAADATQDILLKVVTHLAMFEGRSAFSTWVYRIACHHLLNMRRGRVEQTGLHFARMGDELAQGLADPADLPDPGDGPEQALLLQELRVGCTHAMLICLDRGQRLAYVLGDILELPGAEAALLLDLGEAAFRQRLGRARQRIVAFMQGHCGLVNPDCACRCERRLDTALGSGVVRPQALLFVTPPATGAAAALAPQQAQRAAGAVQDIQAFERAAQLFRRHALPEPPDAVLQGLRHLLEAGALDSLH